MENKKTIAVRIGNMTYRLSAAENPQYITAIAEEANAIMHQIKTENPNLNTVSVAVLALLNALDQKMKMEVEFNTSDQKFTQYRDEADTANTELLKLRETCWELKKDLLYYRNLCEVYEERINDLNQLSPQEKNTQKMQARKEMKPLDRLQTSFGDIKEDK